MSLFSQDIKFHISTYAQRLIRQHIGYFIALIFFGILLFTFIPVQIQQYVSLRRDLAETNESIRELDSRRSIITQYPVEELEDLVLTLNTLYPTNEDRFSIFTALENLQGVTGINIETYSSPFSGKSVFEISIGVKATASLDQYRRFLREHVFKSGRFMTISRVVYEADNQNLNFTAKFYSRHVDIGNQVATQYSPEAVERLQEIQREVESSGLVRKDPGTEDVEIPIDYSTKNNPFE